MGHWLEQVEASKRGSQKALMKEGDLTLVLNFDFRDAYWGYEL